MAQDQTRPTTDAEHILVLRQWFRANPDPKLREMISLAMNDPLYAMGIRASINQHRRAQGKPNITDEEFNRLTFLLKEGVS